jgi:hypothetical protein
MRAGLRLLPVVSALLGLLLAIPARAAEGVGQGAAADVAAETARIATERRAVEARFAQAQAACRERFLVNACLQDARAERRAALDPLQRQQLMLDDLRRRERAAERLRAIQDHAREQALKPPQPAVSVRQAASAPAGSVSAPPSANSVPAERPPAALAASPARSDPAGAAAAAQRARRQHADRVQSAQDHAEAVRQRNAQHEARRPPAAGLPLPAASSP